MPYAAAAFLTALTFALLACATDRKGHGQALAYVYFKDEFGSARPRTKRGGVNFAKLPELLHRRPPISEA